MFRSIRKLAELEERSCPKLLVEQRSPNADRHTRSSEQYTDNEAHVEFRGVVPCAEAVAAAVEGSVGW